MFILNKLWFWLYIIYHNIMKNPEMFYTQTNGWDQHDKSKSYINGANINKQFFKHKFLFQMCNGMTT